jgi:hypothetical protein
MKIILLKTDINNFIKKKLVRHIIQIIRMMKEALGLVNQHGVFLRN